MSENVPAPQATENPQKSDVDAIVGSYKIWHTDIEERLFGKVQTLPDLNWSEFLEQMDRCDGCTSQTCE